MKAMTSQLHVVGGDIPEYPLAQNERLASHWFMTFHFQRWLNSAFRLKAGPEVRAYGFDLFCISQNQTPVGTLPDDDQQLAALLHLDLAKWQDLRARDISPLYKWTHCRCGDEVRLMHAVVTEVAAEAFTKKAKNAASLAEGRERKRRARLVETIKRLGAVSMAADANIVQIIGDWLTTHCDGNWTDQWVRRALEAYSIEPR